MKYLFYILLYLLMRSSLSAQILIPYRVKDKWGYSDTMGNIKIKPQFDQSFFFAHNNQYALVMKTRKYSLVDNKGRLPFNYYDSVKILQRPNLILFRVKNKWGVAKGKSIVVPAVYDYIDDDEQSEFLPARKGERNYSIRLTNFKVKQVPDDYFSAMGVRNDNGTEEYESEASIKNRFGDFMKTACSTPNCTGYRIEALYRFYVTDTAEVVYIQQTLAGEKLCVAKMYQQPTVLTCTDTTYDAITHTLINGYSGNGLMAAKKNGVAGVLKDRTEIVVPFVYDRIEEVNYSYVITNKNGLLGITIFRTPYPPVKNAYQKIVFDRSISVNDRWSLLMFKVWKNGKEGYLGENCVEFFRD